jgi:hypothetical protein
MLVLVQSPFTGEFFIGLVVLDYILDIRYKIGCSEEDNFFIFISNWRQIFEAIFVKVRQVQKTLTQHI